jgi:CubicO group peptidase (beta-lactamase class C family)
MFSRVFTPLGITTADLSWRQNAYRTTTINGIERREMGSGININVDAMARIGYLYLHQGRWDTVQIIPSDFVAAVGTPHGEVSTLDVENDLDNKFRNASLHYGLMWWTNSDGAMAAVPRDAFWAWGLGDNVILVIPSLDIVVSRAGPEFPVSHSPSYYSALEPFFEPVALAD